MLGQEKNFGSGQLIFENWSGGLVDAFFNHNLNFPNLMNVNMQIRMPMQKWQPQVSGAGCLVLTADLQRSSHGENGVLQGGGPT